jgi:hypothetical protein
VFQHYGLTSSCAGICAAKQAISGRNNQNLRISTSEVLRIC